MDKGRHAIVSRVLAAALCLFASSAFALTGSGWNVNAVATNGTATATKAALTNYQHIVYSVDASCATTPAAPILLTVSDASTVVFQTYITVGRTVLFPMGVSAVPAHAVSAALAACGSGVVGSVNLHGKTQ